jgi:hypothetical protein
MSEELRWSNTWGGEWPKVEVDWAALDARMLKAVDELPGEPITLAQLSGAVQLLREANVPTMDGYYVAFVHPYQSEMMAAAQRRWLEVEEPEHDARVRVEDDRRFTYGERCCGEEHARGQVRRGRLDPDRQWRRTYGWMCERKGVRPLKGSS